MNRISNSTENRPRPNFVGSPNMEDQSSVIKKMKYFIHLLYNSKFPSCIEWCIVILTFIVCQDKHLPNAQKSARKVQQDISNAPTKSTFSSEVQISLGYILDECDK